MRTITSLGIDLSLCNTGCVYLNKKKYTAISIKTKKTGNAPLQELKRLLHIINAVNIAEIDIAVIEGLPFGMVRSVSLMQLAGLNYLMRNFLHNNKKQFVIVPPTQLKKYVTGKGNCGKEVMLLETYKRYGVSFTDNNLCDAYGLAQIGLAILDKNTKKLTKIQREIINKLKVQFF